MKTLPILAAAAGVLTFANAASAQLAPSPQLQVDIQKLISDGANIAQHLDIDPTTLAQLANDFQMVTDVARPPSLASVQQLSADGEAAIADGDLSTEEAAQLLNDLNAVLTSAGLSSGQIDQVFADLQDVIFSDGATAADFNLLLTDFTALLADLQGTFLVKTETVSLDSASGASSSGSSRPVRKAGSGDKATIVSSLRAAIGAQASVSVDTASLQAGTYKVSVKSTSTGAKTPLGALVVSGNSGSAVFGSGSTPLPEGVDAADIASVDVEDVNDQPVLSGNTSEAKTFRAGSFALAPGAAGPSTTGDVAFHTKQKPNKTRSTFELSAKKLPIKTKLVLKVNGVGMGTVKSDKKGKLIIVTGNYEVPVSATKITFLPEGVDVGSINTIALETEDGQVVASGGVAN